MKKKAIEKIPFLKLTKTCRKKEVKYIGVTAVKIVSHEKHLFLEVYEKETKDVPRVRIVLTKKDFGTYFPENGAWRRQKITTNDYFDNLVWNTPEDGRGDWKQMEKKNILQDGEDLERIKTFCKSQGTWNDERWWRYIQEYQDNITSNESLRAAKRRHERRKMALDDRIAHTPELPEQMILKRADDLYFRNEHYLYYKKHGSWVKIACSHCGGVNDVRWKGGISFESEFQKRVIEPKEGQFGKCQICGAYGQYKCQGKVKGSHSRKMHLFLGQKYKEKGMVLRYIEVEKTWNLELGCGEKDMGMKNASEELSGIEIARAYFEPGKNLQIGYHKHSWYDGKDYWDDCNLYGNANITINEAPILWETYEEMKGTEFEYSALKEYAGEVSVLNPIRYFEKYRKMPQIEMLVKIGLTRTVQRLLESNLGIVDNQYAKRPDAFLGIRKERIRYLISKKGEIRFLEVLKMEKELNQVWTEEQIEHLAEIRLERGAVEMATRYMSIQQLLNRIEKYAGCEYGTGCSKAMAQIIHTATIYTDYLSMRLNLGYDLNNAIYQHPRNLEGAHNRMVIESNKEALDKRIRETEEKYPHIKQNYRRLRKKYGYEDDTYIIRPARSAGEIVTEGRILHHCVGGDGYLKKHNDGTTYILMLRFKKEPEIPYITVEIDGKRPRIIQWYGLRDKKPDEKDMQQWLDDYVMQMKIRTEAIA